MTTQKTLQLTLIKNMDVSGDEMKCWLSTYTPVQCSKVILDSYSIITDLPTDAPSWQLTQRNSGVEDFYLQFDWLEHGYSGGSVGRGAWNTPGGPRPYGTKYFVDNAFHLTAPGGTAGVLQQTGGLEMQTKNGVIPTEFSVNLFRYIGHRIGDADPGYTRPDAEAAHTAYDLVNRSFTADEIAAQGTVGLRSAFTELSNRAVPYSKEFTVRQTVRIVLNFRLVL